MTEQWKPVVGYEGLYEVSNEGRVRSLDRQVRTKRGFRNYKAKFLASAVKCNGYLVCRLYKNDGGKNFYIHRLLLEAFVGECPNGMEVCHNDDNKNNNHLPNLRWDTHQQNCQERVSNQGEVHHFAKLTEKQVSEIKWALSHYFKPNEIASYYGVTGANIRAIANNKSWRKVSAF